REEDSRRGLRPALGHLPLGRAQSDGEMMLLTTVTFLPLAGALLLMLFPREEENLLRGVGLTTALITFFASLFMLPGFDAGGWNHVVDMTWVEALGIHYHLGVDGISLWLVLLTTFLMPIVLLSAW